MRRQDQAYGREAVRPMVKTVKIVVCQAPIRRRDGPIPVRAGVLKSRRQLGGRAWSSVGLWRG
jgi:hypothetical protein